MIVVIISALAVLVLVSTLLVGRETQPLKTPSKKHTRIRGSPATRGEGRSADSDFYLYSVPAATYSFDSSSTTSSFDSSASCDSGSSDGGSSSNGCD
jgi:hypothetical protein